MNKQNTVKVDYKKTKEFITENAILVSLIILVGIITICDPRFISLTILRDISTQISTRLILALGVAAILITAGCDLSIGRLVGFAAVISASMLQTQDYPRRFFTDLPDLPLWLPILIAILLTTFISFLNGLVVAKLKVPPFIATLAAAVIVYGVTSIYYDSPPNMSQPIAGFRSEFTFIGSGSVFNIPIIVMIALLIMVITWVMLNKTRFGKNIYAVGGNTNAAKVSGVNVDRTILGIYAYAGLLYGLAGVLEAARTGGATNNYGNGYELDAIAACVVGGVSLMGGVGKVSGIVIGVIIFGVINYGLTFIGMSPYWQMIIKGLIIMSAVAFDVLKYLSHR